MNMQSNKLLQRKNILLFYLSLSSGSECDSESSILETGVCIWRYAPLVVHATQEEDFIFITSYYMSNSCENKSVQTDKTFCVFFLFH